MNNHYNSFLQTMKKALALAHKGNKKTIEYEQQ